MKYKATIEKADNITAVLMTENGYPVYDIMVPSKPGYCTASGLAFYTEDEKMLKEFSELRTEEQKQYLLSHPDSIVHVHELFQKIPEMRHPMPLAYNHLLNDFEKTIRHGNYGCTHFIESDKLHVFHQNQVFHKTGYKINNHKETNELYDEIETLVAKLHKSGEIVADGVISGKALERLKARNPEVFKEMTKNQAQVLDILKSFKNELLDHCRLTYDKGQEFIIHIEINNKSYDVTVPAKAKQSLSLTIDNDKKDFKNIHDLIVVVYEEISKNKLQHFIKKMKV